MDSTVFKYNNHHLQQQHQKQYNSSSNNILNNNNNNQNSIFILNTTTNNILPNNRKLHYGDFNDDNNNGESSTSTASSSVWSSASSTMCSPAAHAIQKLFNCSSNSLKLNQGNYSGIESKSFKSKSELLKKKSKFWKYLEGETNENNNNSNNNNNNNNNKNDHHQPAGIDVTPTKDPGSSHKHKSKYWYKSNEIDDSQNHPDLSELLEYSCSLCDNCRCMDCQIAYFDCENSDDSNSEYSFHMNAYDEFDDDVEQGIELKISNENNTLNGCTKIDNKHVIHKFNAQQIINCNDRRQADVHCEYEQCCQQCLKMPVADDFPTTTRDH